MENTRNEIQKSINMAKEQYSMAQKNKNTNEMNAWRTVITQMMDLASRLNIKVEI